MVIDKAYIGVGQAIAKTYAEGCHTFDTETDKAEYGRAAFNASLAIIRDFVITQLKGYSESWQKMMLIEAVEHAFDRLTESSKDEAVEAVKKIHASFCGVDVDGNYAYRIVAAVRSADAKKAGSSNE